MNKNNEKDWELFNCSEQHEINYVKKLYTEPVAVESWINEACKSGGRVNNTPHDVLYAI